MPDNSRDSSFSSAGNHPPLNETLLRARKSIDTFLTKIAMQLCEPLNTQFQLAPHETYAEKKVLAKTINSQLAFLGLAVRCPKTGMPAFLVADIGNDPKVGRFQICAADLQKGWRRTLSAGELPKLDFIPAIDNGRHAASWSDKTFIRKGLGVREKY